MKFAKELEEDAVPEWRMKYFDYKQGKKKIKALSRAVRDVNSPSTPFSRARSTVFKSSPLRPNTASNGSPRTWHNNGDDQDDSSGNEEDSRPLYNPRIRGLNYQSSGPTTSQSIPIPAATQRGAYRRPSQNHHTPTDLTPGFQRYGSIIGTPPVHNISRPETLNLPDPAMETELDEDDSHLTGPRLAPTRTRSGPPLALNDTGKGRTSSKNAFEVGHTRLPFRRYVSFASRMHHKSSHKDPLIGAERPLLKRIFSPRSKTMQANQAPDVPLEVLKQIDQKQEEFFTFLDTEVDKIESFYKSKEEEANTRMEELREQLHIMRDQRLSELQRHEKRKRERKASNGDAKLQGAEELSRVSRNLLDDPSQIKDLHHGMDLLHHPITAARQVHFGKAPRHANLLTTPPLDPVEQSKDYTRKASNAYIPYLTAKRKLKTAMQEYYRGLELLKSYALLNRTALRKVNKKYDKAVRARPTMRYMTEKVNDCYFVTSTVLDGHLTAVEDLYARYFEKGSHKIAVGKLRRRNRNLSAYSGSIFRNGIYLAAGTVLGCQGLVYGTELIINSDPVKSAHTSYLMQIYGGYFLLLFLFLFFCIDCMIFARNKVNYAFVFEFDTRNNLDWKQLSELPCLFAFLLGIVMWLNFKEIGGSTMYIYYPIILIGLAAAVMFCPLSYFYPESRKWLLASMGRLWFGAGLFPVEFRDFFLGDMFCSQTYAMGHIEVLPCLYAHSWHNPAQCNSSHSRLQGFFTALPGVWRALQCLRRYRDTRNIFPHLVNCGKYGFTILGQVSLNMYRINRIPSLKAFFIACSAINSVYCSFWDLHMDWSLLDPDAEHWLLRPHLAYKQTWPYYLAMVLDPLLRFNWVFYVAFPLELQQSAVLSFAIAFTEVLRRGMWTIFRVENEHCTNVGKYRASRDVPLPYQIRKKGHESEEDLLGEHAEEEIAKDKQALAEAGEMRPEQLEELDRKANDSPLRSSDPEANDQHQESGSSGPRAEERRKGDILRSVVQQATGRDGEQRSEAVESLRRRQIGPESLWRSGGLSIRERIGNVMRRAHAQDFERRRPDEPEGVQREESDDDEEQQDEEERESDAEDVERHEDDEGQSRVLERDMDRQDMQDINDAELYLHRARSSASP